jgi:hypothetical protein
MILLVGLVVLTLNMFLPTLPRDGHVAFGVSEPTMGLAVSAYMVAAGRAATADRADLGPAWDDVR